MIPSLCTTIQQHYRSLPLPQKILCRTNKIMSNNSYQRPGIHFMNSSSHQQKQNLPHQNQDKTLILIQNKQRKGTIVFAWCMAAVCTVFWVAVILLGLGVLIVYLVYRPRSPQFDIAAASLNAGYIDTGNLLNADITLLANVINPNTKVNIYLSSLQLDMYFQGIMIGTQVIDAFYEPRQMEALRNLQMITSAVPLPLQVAQEWGNGTQAGGGGVTLHLRGRFRTRWLFGTWLRFTTWLDPSCHILVAPPPNGVLLRKQC